MYAGAIGFSMVVAANTCLGKQCILTKKDAMNQNLQDETLSLQQPVNEQLDEGELISEIEQVREESRVCTE